MAKDRFIVRTKRVIGWDQSRSDRIEAGTLLEASVRQPIQWKADIDSLVEILSFSADLKEGQIAFWKSNLAWLQENRNYTLKIDTRASLIRQLNYVYVARRRREDGLPDRKPEDRPPPRPQRPTRDTLQRKARSAQYMKSQAATLSASPWVKDPSLLPKAPPKRRVED